MAWLKSLKGQHYVPLTHQLSKLSTLQRQSIKDELKLCLTLRYLSHDLTLRRPAVRPSSFTIFGVPIEEVSKLNHYSYGICTHQLHKKVCQREKRPIPHIVTCCVREIERRGLDDLGLYRVSGLATDITKLRKAFDSRNSLFLHWQKKSDMFNYFFFKSRFP